MKIYVFQQNHIMFTNSIQGMPLCLSLNGLGNKTVILCLFED